MDKTVIATLSSVATIIFGWLWVESYFVTRAEFEDAHNGIKATVSEAYLELKIDSMNTSMAFLERDGISPSEQREYDLMKVGVERMSQQLLELR